MTRTTRALISVGAMQHNLAVARRAASAARPGQHAAQVWAVVKANAYGHGIEHALRAFADADGLALVEFDVAARLREAGWQRPIVMLEGAFEPDDVRLAARLHLTLAVHDSAQIAWIERAAEAPAGAILKFNSGMNRLGFDAPGLRDAHARLARTAVHAGLGLMTHFANADLPGGAAEAIVRFERAAWGLPGMRSMANSAALFDLPDALGDAVRPGVMLYGGSPFAKRSAASLGLRGAMTLESRLIAVQRLVPGDAVGYGSIFRATRPMRVGVVACGYADGYPRHAPNGTPVAVAGVRTGTLGRVSMDMLTVDLEPVPSAGVGDRVELWGAQVPIDDVAQAAGTIGYELMCALAPRVPVTVGD